VQRAQLSMGDTKVLGFQQTISNAQESGKVNRPCEIFPNLSRKLISLHSLDNRLGNEPDKVFESTVCDFLLHATGLLNLSLARNFLRCEHVKSMCLTSLTFLDLSQNGISNAGMEMLITGENSRK